MKRPAPKRRSIAAANLRWFKPKVVRAKKGKGSFRRNPRNNDGGNTMRI